MTHARIELWHKASLSALALALVMTLNPPALAQTAPPPLPSFAQLEAAGAVIGKIVIVNNNIFDTDKPEENKLLFRWANALHVRTRVGVIERALLFKTGDRLTVRLLDEAERELRENRFLQDVDFRALAFANGVVDIEVTTSDTWTLEPGASVGRVGGVNSSSVALREYNLLGTGISISLGYAKGAERSGNEFQIANERAFGGWTAISYSLARNSDGGRQGLSVARPFYSLDTRWAAGVALAKDERIDTLYSGSATLGQYRHWQKSAEVYGGWSPGLQGGWVQRYSAGVRWQDDRYAPKAGLAAPPKIPADQDLVTPFVRFELLEDRFEKTRNLDQIGRPEFLQLGLALRAQLGRSATALGASRDAWIYGATISRGFEPIAGQRLIASAALSGEYADGEAQRLYLRGRAQYYLPHSGRWLFYASGTLESVTNPGVADILHLGGDNGLRGYAVHTQSGARRALFTMEERFYTDMYWFSLFRVGAAAFIDTGRAWGGPSASTNRSGWLSNVGVGLRIFSVRSAFSNVLHLDVAVPTHPLPGDKRVQFQVKTRSSF